MSTAMAIPGNAADMFLIHYFGDGLDGDDRFMVKRFKALSWGDIRPVPDNAADANGRRRSDRTEIIICTGLRKRGGKQSWVWLRGFYATDASAAESSRATRTSGRPDVSREFPSPFSKTARMRGKAFHPARPGQESGWQAWRTRGIGRIEGRDFNPEEKRAERDVARFLNFRFRDSRLTCRFPWPPETTPVYVHVRTRSGRDRSGSDTSPGLGPCGNFSSCPGLRRRSGHASLQFSGLRPAVPASPR